MSEENQTQVELNLAPVQIGTGLYRDPESEGIVLVNLGEIIAAKQLEDSQELRVALYGVVVDAFSHTDDEIVLIAEPDVPPIREVAASFRRPETSRPESPSDPSDDGLDIPGSWK